MTAAVVGTKMTTRATSSSSRVSRGALTIVNSGAGPKRVRPTRARTNARRDGWNARARGGAVVVVVHGDRAREGRRARGMTTRNDGCGEIKFFFYVSRGSRRGRARGDVDGGRGRSMDRSRDRDRPRVSARGVVRDDGWGATTARMKTDEDGGRVVRA